MLIELSVKLGDPPDAWARKPWVWARYCYLGLREHERVTAWEARRDRWELAYLVGKAFHEPPKLVGEEKDRILVAARSKPAADDARERGLRLLAELTRSQALES